MLITLNKLIPHPIIELDHADSQIWEAEHISFDPAKRYLISAESGKGKTSLLSVIYGIRKDYNGEVKIDGENIRDFSLADWTNLRRQRLSYIFQGLDLFPELTARENLDLKNNLTQHYSQSEIEAMATQLHVDHLLERPAQILSFGQRQRFAIIRALCQPFDYLFLDEPFSHLDRQNIIAALELINSTCQNNGAGLILTSLDDEYKQEFDSILRV